MCTIFTKLDDARSECCCKYPCSRIREIKAEFEDAVAYQSAQILNTVQAPVRLMGLHKSWLKIIVPMEQPI